MPEWFAFFIGTVFLTYVSRNALRIPKSHGFYRFFAWELMLIMIVLNMDGWYSAPLTIDQIICGILMAISLFLVVISYESLRLHGKQSDSRSDPHLMPFEKTTELVTSGIYRFIRHPMYSSLIFLDWGLFFKQMSWLSGILASLACILMVIASFAEENENIHYFGAKYQEYMKHSKRFLPFLL